MYTEKPSVTASVAELYEGIVPEYHLSGKPIIFAGGAMDIWQDGKPKGQLGFNSYQVKGRWADAQYVFCNGGPSSPSSKYHGLGIGGLQTVLHDEDGYVEQGNGTWRQSTELNFQSAITKGDLITIDPFGTGKSWSSDRSWAYTMGNDVAAIAAAALAFRKVRGGADLFIPVVSSFGSYRSEMARHFRHAGFGVPSMVIMGGSYDTRLAQYTMSRDTVDSYALRLPAMALAAQAHKRLGAREQRMQHTDLFAEVARFALDVYAPLLKSDKLSSATRVELTDKLTTYTGLSLEFIASQELYISPADFRKNLLPGQMVSAVDTRVARPTAPERIDILLDEWEIAYGGLLLAGIQEGFFPQNFAEGYGGIIQASSEWTFDGIWSQRRMHECMGRLISENPNMTIVDIAGLYELIRPAPMSLRFWGEMRQRTGIDVHEYPSSELRHSSSLDGVRLGPGVHSFALATGHQVSRHEHARGQIGAILRSLGDAAVTYTG